MNSKFTSTSFWATVIAGIAVFITGITDVVPAEWAAIAGTVVAALYALSRGLAKYNLDVKNGYKTREFWISLFTIIGLVAVAIPGNLTSTIAVVCSSIVAGVYAVSRGISANPQNEVK
jgi:hypothetical protein